MKLATYRILIARAVLASTALFAIAVATPLVRAEDWSKSYSISGRANVRVETNDGAVQVFTGESKQVEFRVSYEGYEINRTLHVLLII